jgi:hypothetical protein
MMPAGAILRHREIRATQSSRRNQENICGKPKSGKDVVDAKITFYLNKQSLS